MSKTPFEKLDKKEQKKLANYFKSKRCLIIDPTRCIRTPLKKILVDLGVNASKISQTEKFQEAQESVYSNPPQVVFSALKIEDNSALELIDQHTHAHPNRLAAAFILLSEQNSAASACAVLEKDIDAYIAEPFTIESLQQAMVDVFLKKISPSKADEKIFKAKELIFRNLYDEAKTVIDEAKEMGEAEDKSNALFLEGFIHQKEERLQEAIASFEEGIKENPIHYRCLNGLVQCNQLLNNFTKAYEYSGTMLDNYPLDPEKIPALIRLCIQSRTYEDVLNFSEVFTKLPEDQINDEIKIHVSAGLAICGKFLLASLDNKDKALATLEKSAELSNNKFEIIANIINTLDMFDCYTLATKMIEKFALALEEHEDWPALEFQVTCMGGDNMKSYNHGYQIIKGGNANYTVYQSFVKLSVKLGKKKDVIEDVIQEAGKKYPEKKVALFALIPKDYE